jgi:hypothetical protein
LIKHLPLLLHSLVKKPAAIGDLVRLMIAAAKAQ